jgi:UDP-N-acetylglucosamine 4,6-dehydratase
MQEKLHVRILVTGGTGFFGQAMMRRLLDDGNEVCCLSRDEAKQARLRPYFPQVKWYVGDVRDRMRVRRALFDCDAVIHAAALKRIEVGAENPMEMVQTNVLGTRNVAEEAEHSRIDMVMLSTDKAWQPVSPYGYSKALAESVALASGASCVRYGNVANSTGSVIPTWRECLRSGSPSVKVTDLDCTRFYMHVSEAVDLVIDTMEAMSNMVAIPTWLPAYRLGDLLEAMGIDFYEEIGLPSWEKLHEGMSDGVTSDVARRMSVEELRKKLEEL